MERVTETPKLSPALEGKYKLVGIVPGVVRFHKHGPVDFCSISLEMADQLYAEKCIYLQKIEAPVKSTK